MENEILTEQAEQMPVKVFIIDDNIAARSMLTRHIKDVPDIELVGEAGTGQGGIIMLGGLFPDVVLLEAAVGGGMKLEDIIKEINNVSPDTKIILCTDYTQKEHMAEITENGQYDFIAKPFMKHDVLRTIRNTRKSSLHK